MLSGNNEAKENFKYQSKHGIRGIATIFISNQKFLDELVDKIPEDTLTGFHLKDIFDKTKKIHEIKQTLYDTALFNKRFPKSLMIDKQIIKDKEEKEEKRKQNIDFDIQQYFKDQGILDCINKL